MRFLRRCRHRWVSSCDGRPSAAQNTRLNTPSAVPQDQRVKAEPRTGEERNYHLDMWRHPKPPNSSRSKTPGVLPSTSGWAAGLCTFTSPLLFYIPRSPPVTVSRLVLQRGWSWIPASSSEALTFDLLFTQLWEVASAPQPSQPLPDVSNQLVDLPSVFGFDYIVTSLHSCPIMQFCWEVRWGRTDVFHM